MLSKSASSSIFWDFGITQPGIEPQSPELLANTLPICPMAHKSEYLEESQRVEETYDLDLREKSLIKVGEKKSHRVMIIIMGILIVTGALGWPQWLDKGPGSWRLEDVPRPSKLQHYWDWLEDWKECWRLEWIWCHLESTVRPSGNAGEKNSLGAIKIREYSKLDQKV